MSDSSESGAQPVEDAAVPDPPTVDADLAARDRDSAEAPAADPNYDEPGDNPLAAEDDDD